MDDAQYTAAMTAFSALASELQANGNVSTEGLIARLQLGQTNLSQLGQADAAQVLKEYLAGAVPAWRIASTQGLRPS